MKMISTIYVSIILLVSLLDRINGEERCDNNLAYEKCSSNIGCGCLPLGDNDRSSICTYLYVTCSELSSCARDNRTCYQLGHICVKHSRCQNNPLCYPVKMTTPTICPFISTTSISPIPDDGICENAEWNPNGFTIAGGNGEGSGLNQFQDPFGIFLDDDSNLYIADSFNNRIVKWDHGSTVGQLVAGGNGEGGRNDQLNNPKSITVAKNGTMFICDSRNHRIQKWEKNAREGETIITNGTCLGIYLDNQGSLYYSDGNNQKILKWPENETIAGGNGQGDRLNQLSFPRYFFIKNNKSIVIADGGNHRIVEWVIGDKQGVLRAGGNGIGNNLNQLDGPISVIIDQWDNLYITDFNNDRIMRWSKNSTSGIIIVGERGMGSGKDQLFGPSQMLFDKSGNLWVSDQGNNRIQMFTIDKSDCKNK